jgi:DNA-binding transcriptional MocR family regulator
MRRQHVAAELVIALIEQMRPGGGGVIVASRQTMAELVGVSMSGIERALRLLIEEGWVQRIKVGGAHALAINSRVAWIGARGDLPHAIFTATVVASRKEQDEIALAPPPIRHVPVLMPGEDPMMVGPGEDPPSQPDLTEIPPLTGRYAADPDTGEIHNYQQELEQRGQQRLELPIDAPKCGGGDGVRYTECNAPKLKTVHMGQTYSDSRCENCGGYVRHSWD